MKSLLDHPVASPKRHHRQLPRRPSSSPVWLVLALTLGVWAFCLYMHQAQPDQEISAKPIAEVQLGDRVPGTNPIEPEDLQFGRDVDPATWRRVALQGYLADGSLMEFEILRPVQWIRENRVEANGSVHMEFDELGFRGKAKVKEITECPPIRLGPGAPVTAVFRHYAQEVFDLETENGESIGVTGNHPIWSEERQEFVPARELKPGEQLRHLNGETRFLRLAKRKGGYVVHNLEVLGTHVYHVANSGLLVHNTGKGNVLPCPLTAGAKKASSGIATGADDALDITGKWLTEGVGGHLPKTVADKLRGRTFRNWDDFRQEFWKAVGEDKHLLSQFTQSNQALIKKGKSPFAPKPLQHGGNMRYELHHIDPVEHGGGVFDLDNIMVLAPKTHKGIHDPQVFVPSVIP